MFVLCFFQNASAQAALQAAQALSGDGVQGGPNTVLRVIVEHMLYPVTLDVLNQVRYGKDASEVPKRRTDSRLKSLRSTLQSEA